MVENWKNSLPQLLQSRRTAVICCLILGAFGLILMVGAFSFSKVSPTGNAAKDMSRMVSLVPLQSLDSSEDNRVAVMEKNITDLDTTGLAQPSTDPNWVSQIAAETGISEKAVAAYANASLYAAEDYPGCGLGWNTLAAIGHVESHHGTINGSHLDDSGTATPSIVGPALDGQAFKAIRDTDKGLLDGDPLWDRAVGPMQFIPQTWEMYGQDGNGDGNIDPQNINDAAQSAAVLLCNVGGDLTVDQNWIAAVNAYNQSVAYNHEIVDAANYYATFN